MIRSLLVSILFLLSVLSLHSQEVYEHQFLVKVGDKAPDFEILLSDGTIFKLSDQLGKVVMLQFTASWCGVCRKEMPHIERDIWQPLKDKEFVLVGMDYKENPDVVMDFAKQMNISYPLGMDTTGGAYHLFSQKGSGVTRNVIIDKKGKIIMLTRLFDFDEFEKMKELIFDQVD